MKVTLAVSHSCPHCRFLKKYFTDRDLEVEVKYIEECPDYQSEHDITCSPNVAVGEKVMARGMPTPAELEHIVQVARGES